MEKLTRRQAEVLALIKEFISETGMPPTRHEIAAALGFSSPNGAEGHLRALARKGVIELVAGSSRGIRLIELPDGIPMIGRVPNGKPILTAQHIEHYYQLDSRLFTPSVDYLLKVRGHSMRNAGICDGDLLAVHSTTEVRSGVVAVIRLDGVVMVRRLHRRGHSVQLLPDNPDFESVEIDARSERFAIEGLGVGMIRISRL